MKNNIQNRWTIALIISWTLEQLSYTIKGYSTLQLHNVWAQYDFINSLVPHYIFNFLLICILYYFACVRRGFVLIFLSALVSSFSILVQLAGARSSIDILIIIGNIYYCVLSWRLYAYNLRHPLHSKATT